MRAKIDGYFNRRRPAPDLHSELLGSNAIVSAPIYRPKDGMGRWNDRMMLFKWLRR